MNLRQYTTVTDRRKALEKEVGVPLSNIGTFSLDESSASTKNCENMIGVAQIPIGIAGPLMLTDLTSRVSHVYIPLATTEGALVASVNRGCKAITESGGAVTDTHAVGATRGPVFRVNSLSESKKLYEFFDTHLKELKTVTEATSHHLTLKKITSRGVGRYRFARFVYDTQDAMGLNMVTIATQAAVTYIKKETGISCVALSGNFCTDKKPSWQNFVENRGHKAWAEVTIPKNVLQDTLKTSAQASYETWLAKCMIGSSMSGSMGFNAQYANVLAALFIATGQDPAHVAECSIGITTAEVVNGEDLYVSVYLPDLMVGTVGGGTTLATQQEALRLMGVVGSTTEKTVDTFAQIVAGAVLAGEISLLSSLEQGALAQSHQRLARGGTSV
jgi:hydroxymethylglutaryl-CoA reductase (NADPH)